MPPLLPHWLQAVADILMPRICPVCGKALDRDEPYLCRSCLAQLPRTRYEEIPFNTMEQLFAGIVPVERATAYFYYEKNAPYATILHDIKYHHQPLMGQWLTAQAVKEMEASGFFAGIDLVTPVPLHSDKLAQRGYNQSEYLARGIAQQAGITPLSALTAVKGHSTQTHKGAMERWQNIQGNYAVNPQYAAQLAGKHLLLVDDVVTTGSTLAVCALALRQAEPSVRISIFTLAAARLS